MAETTSTNPAATGTADMGLQKPHNAQRPVYDIGLSDEEVSRILDKLTTEEVGVKGSERRSLRRFMLGTALIVGMSRPGFATADFRVRLRNISRHGVAFISRYVLDPGTILHLQLPIGPDLGITQEPAVVVRCRSVEEGVYEIGADFTRA